MRLTRELRLRPDGREGTLGLEIQRGWGYAIRTSRRSANSASKTSQARKRYHSDLPPKSFKQIAYLLHLPLEKAIPLGAFTLWPYRRERKTRIADASARAYLNKYFKLMRGADNRPLKNIAILSASNKLPLRRSTKRTSARMHDSLLGLFLCAVLENDRFLGSVSTENFQLIFQNFRPESDGWATSDGSYLTKMAGGLKLKDAGIRLPRHIPDPSRFFYDQKLLNALLNCLDSESPLRDKVFRAIRFVSHAYSNTENFSYHNRVLLMTIAFEILKDQREGFKQHTFAAWLDSLWGIPETKKFPLRNRWAKGKGRLGAVGWWGIEFYRARNSIVHGNPHKVKASDSKGREYFLLSVRVFAECVRALLRREGHLDRPTDSEVFSRDLLLSSASST